MFAFFFFFSLVFGYITPIETSTLNEIPIAGDSLCRISFPLHIFSRLSVAYLNRIARFVSVFECSVCRCQRCFIFELFMVSHYFMFMRNKQFQLLNIS